MRASLPESDAIAKTAPSDAELLRLCREGNQLAAAAIHKRYEQRVRGLAQRHWPASMRSRYDPDDIVQEVFDRFFRAARHWTLFRERRGWVVGISLLVVTLNQIRKASTPSSLASTGCTPNHRSRGLYQAAEGAMAQDAGLVHSTLIVDEFLASLPHLMREAVERRLHGFTVAEIARDLAISQRATERLFHAVRQRIGDCLELSALPAPAAPICLRQDTAKTAAPTPSNELLDDARRIKIA